MWKWLEKLTGVADTLVLTKEYERARTKKGRYKVMINLLTTSMKHG